MAQVIRKYGLRPTLPDARDMKLTYSWPFFKPLPKAVDLRGEMPPVWNQLNTGSCTAFASLAAWHHIKAKQIREKKDDDKNLFEPSFLFQYFNTRVLEGTESYDSGASIGGAFKSIWKWGTCPAGLWPYIEEKYTEKPPAEAYRVAQDSQILNYLRVPLTLRGMKGCLADGYVITLGICIYESFEDENGVSKTGIMAMPKSDEKLLGGHAVTVCGYNDQKEAFLVRNSWGYEWGEKGYFWMPYRLLSKQGMVMDAYSIRRVE